MVAVTVTLPELRGESSSSVSRKEVESSAEIVEMARGIEPPTCGLQNRNMRVAQVVEDMGNPLVITGDSQFFQSFCFSCLNRVYA